MIRGDSYTYTLNQGDVLEMFSALGDINKAVYASATSRARSSRPTSRS